MDFERHPQWCVAKESERAMSEIAQIMFNSIVEVAERSAPTNSDFVRVCVMHGTIEAMRAAVASRQENELVMGLVDQYEKWLDSNDYNELDQLNQIAHAQALLGSKNLRERFMKKIGDA